MTVLARLAEFPLIAILRGVKPQEAVAIGEALVEAGFRIIEVPLNSPEPMQSIEALARRFPDVLIGAGTVLDPADADRVKQAGGELILMPHSDPAVIARAKALGQSCVPGVATPTEAFAALKAGADALKMFPAEMLPPPVVKAWGAILPASTVLLPVGGVTPERLKPYWQAGARGFGLGSALYAPGLTASEVARNAQAFVAAAAELKAS
ncbi:2-dehydro-3-deoxy-6-phosphogalactonate aldolase [Ancylobacter defluvii]|uniref:2-dehydro-3-deoxy-6-phosphogalactonate aldolase n=1 Tax=Ancylobacter defluvii TaxID=1282440 RepID=A0A9W6JVR7_9HYPH|nr:2-dehydro-3-deoxy-6-phosphogalactonate aldolase [Ancylobacter defluvii]MBS7590511.1 2-dehydro-3-deoxy-6-phosphogalactonate aldolase [Ancylobacter defluvii]GLK83433.1 2-dehydro-3-deoxy-6-phosphogalactonate aldolase [Ancylobacter defluvii]